jgi:hypothetical protein
MLDEWMDPRGMNGFRGAAQVPFISMHGGLCWGGVLRLGASWCKGGGLGVIGVCVWGEGGGASCVGMHCCFSRGVKLVDHMRLRHTLFPPALFHQLSKLSRNLFFGSTDATACSINTATRTAANIIGIVCEHRSGSSEFLQFGGINITVVVKRKSFLLRDFFPRRACRQKRVRTSERCVVN